MSALSLKLLAMLFMLLDHIGYAFADLLPHPLFIFLRTVGRFAMPLFCFMIAEGLYHTKDVRRYLLRLAAFAVVSEIPFDLLVSGTPISWKTQNVMITLLLGLLGILLYDTFAAKGQKGAALLAIVATAGLAELCRSDYGMFGVYYIFVFYYFRGRNRPLTAALGVGVLLAAAAQYIPYANLEQALISLGAMGALVPIVFYSGKPGGGTLARRALYLFYPAHMLFLVLLRLFFPL